MIKMIDLAADYQLLKGELDPAIHKVLEKGNYIQGEEVRIFEQHLANYLQVKHVISCANGTDALQIALMAFGIKADDEVIIPAFTYISVIEVICLLGATPVLVDVNSDTYQLDESQIEQAITARTKAIIPVHLFGACGNLEAILKIAKTNQIFVIEDNAQALGAKYNNQFLGTLGDIGCTSFFPTKNLACFGDGGALFTNDEVIIPAFTYISVIEVICLLGATPVFVDVNSDTYQLDENQIQRAITARTKAIIPVHLFGACGNLEAILKIAKTHQIFVVEDNAQALGAKYKNQFLGSFGDIGCSSFFPTKNLACFGDGGALFTNDDLLAERIRAVANHGQKGKYNHVMLGLNSRLDTLQASILSIKLIHLNKNLSQRKAIANQYLRELKDIPGIVIPQIEANCEASWNQFTIQIKNHKRDSLKQYLYENGVETMVYYPKALNQQDAYINFEVSYKNSNNLALEVLSLPIHPLLKQDEVLSIIKHIKAFFNV